MEFPLSIKLNTQSTGLLFRLPRILVVLALSSWFLATSTIGAGESTVEIPIPAGIEKGLEDAGIKIETSQGWLDESTAWIAGSIIVAGFVIAYAVRRKKA